MKTTFAFATEKLDIFGFEGFDALIRNKLEGGIHSGKMVQALQQKVQSLGGEILTGIDVEKWEHVNGVVQLQTKQQIIFQASRVVICTNALSQHLMQPTQVSPARGQIIVTSPIDDLPFSGTFHFDEGFYYFRNVGNRVLLGGARNKAIDEEATTEMETSEAIQQSLERFLAEHILPNSSAYTIDYRWSGIMGFTQNKQPFVEPPH